MVRVAVTVGVDGQPVVGHTEEVPIWIVAERIAPPTALMLLCFMHIMTASSSMGKNIIFMCSQQVSPMGKKFIAIEKN